MRSAAERMTAAAAAAKVRREAEWAATASAVRAEVCRTEDRFTLASLRASLQAKGVHVRPTTLGQHLGALVQQGLLDMVGSGYELVEFGGACPA